MPDPTTESTRPSNHLHEPPATYGALALAWISTFWRGQPAPPPAPPPRGPADVAAFPRRPTNDAMAWLASGNVTRRAYHVGRILAQAARVADRPDRKRHIRPGDLTCYVAGSTIVTQLRERGHPMSLRTVRRAIADLEDAGLKVRRTAHTSTYVFPLPLVSAAPTDMEQKLQQIRARFALRGTLHGTPVGTPVEPRRDLQEYPKEGTTTRARARLDEKTADRQVQQEQEPTATDKTTKTTTKTTRTTPPATARQCQFAADLEIDVTSLDIAEAGERIEIARADRIAETRRDARRRHEHDLITCVDYGMRCRRCHKRQTRPGGWCPVPAPPPPLDPAAAEDHENRAGYVIEHTTAAEDLLRRRRLLSTEFQSTPAAEPADRPPDGLPPAGSAGSIQPFHPPDGAGASLAQAAGDAQPPHKTAEPAAAEPEPEPIDTSALRRAFEDATGRPCQWRPRQ